VKLPPVRLIRRNDTHRLIPSKYAAESVLARIADDDAHLADIFDLDNATNDRLLAENNLLPGIGIHELVFDLPYFRIVNAAFCHAHPLGSRFNGPDRGAWYAGFEIRTAQAEVAFHKSVELAETGWLDEDITYDDYLADFSAANARSRLARHRLSERSPARRHLPCVPAASAGDECAQGGNLALCLEGRQGAAGLGGQRLIRLWLAH